jgi:Tol biopolymer transport system component
MVTSGTVTGRRSAWSIAVSSTAVLALVVGVVGTPQLGATAVTTDDSAELAMTEVTNVAASVSPDGGSLALDVYGLLWMLPVDSGRATRITEPTLEATRPVWSPEGDLIAFQSYRGGNYHIWVIRPDGTGLRQVTTGPFDDREPAWSPDGSEIAFSSDRAGDGSLDIWSVEIESGGLTRRTADVAEEYEPAWAPDGKRIAFVEGRGQSIIAVSVDGVRETLAGGGGRLAAPSWTPDGSTIVYSRVSRTASDLVMDGRAVTQGEDVFTFAPSWLPDGRMVYTADGGVRVRDLDTGDKQEVPFEAVVPLQRPSWEPAARDWSSSATKPVRGLVNPRLSPDGRSVAFAALNDLYVMTEGTPRQLTDDGYWEYDVEWTADGSSITYTSDRAGSPDVYLRELVSGSERRLTSGPGAEYGASLSPQMDRLAFLDENNGLSVLTIESGEVESLGSSPGRELWEGTSWSPDGKYIALGDGAFGPNTRFREDFNSIWVVDAQTGEQRPHRVAQHGSTADLGDSGPVWSPDGAWMAFVMESVLWVIPVGPDGAPTGEASKVTEETADSPSWSGNSERLLYLHHGELRSVGIDGSDVQDHPVRLRWQNHVARGRTVVHAGRLWDGTGEQVVEDVDIVLDGDRIVAVQPHRPGGHRGARFIDASDKTVVPGMFEMHSHPQDMRYYATKWWSFYLSMGFTSNVSMGGFLPESVANRESTASGRLVGPRAFVAGELFDGSRVSHPETRAIVSDAQLELELDRQRALEPDLYKSYVRLPPEQMARVAEVAHEEGVPAFTHILATGALVGQDGTSHLGATQRAGYNNVTSATGRSYQDVLDIYTTGRVDLVATPFQASRMLGLDPALAQDPRVQRLLPAGDVERVERGAAERPSSQQVAEIATSMKIYTDILRAGGDVATGTDAPLAVPGVQNHMILRAYVEAGMTEVEALRTVTSIPAKLLGVSQDLGTITTGKLADLVFIDGDPLSDIGRLADVTAVMKAGTYVSREELLAAFPERTAG